MFGSTEINGNHPFVKEHKGLAKRDSVLFEQKQEKYRAGIFIKAYLSWKEYLF
jgi:hypothetical protein